MVSPSVFKRATLNYRQTNIFRIPVAQTLGEISPDYHQDMCQLTKPEFLKKSFIEQEFQIHSQKHQNPDSKHRMTDQRALPLLHSFYPVCGLRN